MNDETGEFYVTIHNRGTFALSFYPVAGSGGVEEVKFTGSVFAEHMDSDKGWDYLNRVVDSIKAELGVTP